VLALGKDPSRCFPEVAEAAVTGLDRIATPDAESETFDWDPEERRLLGPEFLANLLEALQYFKSGTLCGAAAEKIAARPETFSPVTLVVPAIEQMRAEGRQMTAAEESIVNLWTSAAEFLLRCSEVPPEPPSDWRLNAELSCSCPDCLE
jgi:hypothetical protein